MATVAITGAGRGIGLELARQHVEAGDRVLALVRDPAGAKTLADLAAASAGKLTVHRMDVGDDASVRAGAADTGSEPVDVLYNVAGVSGPEGAELESADWDAWDETFRIMVQGPLRVLQAFLPRLGAGAKVINISSQLAASTWPYGGYYAYSGAKAALNRMMRSVAIDLKDRGVIVGLVHPGWVQTDMGGEGADITPAESAAGIRKVASDWTLERSGDFLKWNGEEHAW
ncbi:short-chain dehydrogenase/reductase SDR (plasmid) [Novosphingobium aromaticivorans DSM 12444]|uniref:Short-chain dehydrogenase/reductase SDR n=1 Tax=Novosphingobium aromaticivorans (strain ATCC 700278 / DSM 12444 / CCUG 56034 / CIP 105152 / NBRC 16084 / F199) TaxID=279238 RepID=A4XEM7_NOVAD|nr:SDR family oxidoreductase [Novosphingobium aromaticivorans]ABP64388.1 short-chain dehydrogenase/reductase SDR [Novosphingobium aromaticivorans DSM 12444]SCY90499.1 NAD(P)-dependent dehydrogenase, short-chain alcohol dehydrogenase family [Novosphingobium aromaticivorans]